MKKTSADLKQLFGFEPASVNATDEGEWKECKPMLSNAPLSDRILPSHVLMTEKEQGLYVQCSEYFFQMDQRPSLPDGLKDHVTFAFMGSEDMQYGVSGGGLVRK